MTETTRSGPALLQVTTVSSTHRAFLLPFTRHFRSLGWRVGGMAAGIETDPECVAAYDEVHAIEWSRNPWDPRNLSVALRRVQGVVVEGRYDLVHVHTPVAGFVVRYALRQLRHQLPVKVVYTAHGFHFYEAGSSPKNLAFRTLEQIAGKWTDCLIVINREDHDSSLRYNLVSEDRLVYMPGIGIDTRVYSPNEANVETTRRVRDELGIGDSTPLFLMVAEFNPNKRHLDVVQALARLDNQAAHLAFAGEGPLLRTVRARVRELGMSERVHFLGRRRDIPVLMRASTATVMSSAREGLNRSVMESLALEVPVIGSSARGVADLLNDGCGIIFPVGDIDALAGALQWALDHPEEARNMARQGRQRIVAHHDIAKIVRLHEEVYAQLLGNIRKDGNAILGDDAMNVREQCNGDYRAQGHAAIGVSKEPT